MFAIISALSLNQTIGVDNCLPWHLPDDLKFFNRVTQHHKVVMGRNTWLSIGKALPKRDCYILTTKPQDMPYPDIQPIDTPTLAEWQNSPETIFIGGGKRPYEEFLPYTHKLYLTWVLADIKGTCQFPEMDMNEWSLESYEYHPADSQHAFPFVMCTYNRKNSPKVFTSNRSIV